MSKGESEGGLVVIECGFVREIEVDRELCQPCILHDAIYMMAAHSEHVHLNPCACCLCFCLFYSCVSILVCSIMLCCMQLK
jgi:hypothetical protein